MGYLITPEQITTLKEVRRLIDRLELYGQTTLNNKAFQFSANCWSVIEGMALVYGWDYETLEGIASGEITLACKHEKIVCPNHDGGYDCSPFCRLCEGEQYYCLTCQSEEA